MTKQSFRQSKAWKDFRKSLTSKQKTDPLTGSKLAKGSHCHHRDLREENYFDLTQDNHFVILNNKSHDIVHFAYNSKCGWQQFIKNLKDELTIMDRINKGLE